ncbi:hypothetical protein GWK48_09905 [Metallosphaera tengchongensis]|uniref:ZIP family metal transporter n=1 Tax=Metallosphaera tengchongensis TaxID=1532350 RepID=A0A6N0NV25_9CREN|nr:hypothetical protein [Metallosphaera tengchongensis]QKR00656.1 hypothetical protein GWK48_09905 [Metallosphaera tengchongensis]
MMQLIQLFLMSSLVAYSILVTYPLAFRKMSGRRYQLFNGIALGILIYLIMDIFSGTYTLLDDSPILSFLFIVPFVLSYFGFHLYSSMRVSGVSNEKYAETVSLIISLGIGLQNFTEGLAIGGSLRLGLSTVLIPLVVGLTLQNVTEGFPIASPFLKTGVEKERTYLLYMYLLGGSPTLLGSLLSYVLASTPLVVVFNALAMGGILFVALEMYKGMVKHSDQSLRNVAEVGIAIGIVITFLVNLLP